MKLDLATFLKSSNLGTGKGNRVNNDVVTYRTCTNKTQAKKLYVCINIGGKIGSFFKEDKNLRLTAYYKDGIVVVKPDINGRKSCRVKNTDTIYFKFPYVNGFPISPIRKETKEIYFEDDFIYFTII